jgi:hypothetical protein
MVVAQYRRNVYAKCFCKEASEHRARGVSRKLMLDVCVDGVVAMTQIGVNIGAVRY